MARVSTLPRVFSRAGFAQRVLVYSSGCALFGVVEAVVPLLLRAVVGYFLRFGVADLS